MYRVGLLAALILVGACKTREEPKKGRGPLAGQNRPPISRGDEEPEVDSGPQEPEEAPLPPANPGSIDVTCPPDAIQYGQPPPEGKEVYCARLVDGVKVKQGRYRLWKGEVLIRDGEFDNDLKTGEWNEWYDDGTHKSQAQYSEGKYNGPWKTWHENGELSGEGTYVEGKKDGRTRFFYENGELKAESNYADDLREGRSVNYFPSGKLQSEGSYVAGIKEGPWVDLDESGAKTTSTYRDGKRIGP